MRGRRRLERRLTDPRKTWSEMTSSLMGMRMSMGTPSGVVPVLRRMNGRVAEAMGMKTKSRLSRSIRMRQQRRKK